MNFRKGDILVLKEDAYNTTTNQVLFTKGTEVKIHKIKSSSVEILFPDNVLYEHQKSEVPYLFANKNTGKILTKSVIGTGTPPKELFQYLPEGADWKRNYIYKIHIELEEREEKIIICPDCTNEFPKEFTKDDLGRSICPACNKTVVPFNIKENFS